MPTPHNIVSIAFTASGAPQAATLIRHLRNNGDCHVRLIALDMKPDVIGSFFADAFCQIPQAGMPGYKQRILEVLRQEKPDALLNCSENDVPPLADMADEIEALGTKFIGPPKQTIATLTNKLRLYERFTDNRAVKIPKYLVPTSVDEFVKMARELGYPKRDVCFKPHRSKGSRGFRILTERFSKRELLLEHKPTARYMSLDEFVGIFREDPNFPELLLMEVVAGEELDCMGIAYNGEALLCTVKTRESHRWGVIDRGELVRRPETVETMKEISRELGLSYNIYFQFISGYLIELGPRTSTYIFGETFCEPWIAVKLGLGMVTPDDVRAMQSKIPYGRRMLRYMDQIFYGPNGTWSN